MNLLSRYILSELIKVFLVTSIGMTTMMILVGVVQEAIQQNLTPATILQLIPFLIPKALFFAIPATTLFAVCNVFARMSAANEMVAIKSIGQSPLVVVWPAIILAFLLSLVTVILNDVALPWGRQGVYRVILNSVEKTIYAVLAADQKFNNGRLSFSVSQIEGRDLYGLQVRKFDSDPKKGFRLSAQQARLSSDPVSHKLKVWIKNGTSQIGDEATVTIDEGTLDLELADATRKPKSLEDNPAMVPLSEMASQYRSCNSQLSRQRRNLAMSAAFQMLGGNLVGLTDPIWGPEFHELREVEIRKHKIACEPWRRWANGFSCLCFVMVGAPLALRLPKADFWVVFFLCFFPIVIVYYPLLMFGVSQTKTGALPPMFVWFGNVVLLAAGMYMLVRLARK